MGYKALLEKYVRHVLDCEGITFLGGVGSLSHIFTDEEAKALQEIQDKLEAEAAVVHEKWKREREAERIKREGQWVNVATPEGRETLRKMARGEEP